MGPAELYDLIYGADEGDVAVVRELCRRLAPGGKVLELACGTGRLLLPAVVENPDLQFTGIDLDEGFLARCRAKAQSFPGAAGALESGRLVLVEGDMTRLGEIGQLRRGSFDLAVLAVSSIVHVEYERLPLLFEGVANLLARDGCFFVDLTLAAAATTGSAHDQNEDRPEKLRACRRNREPPYDLYQRDRIRGRQIERTFRFHFLGSGRDEFLTIKAHRHDLATIEAAARAAGLVPVDCAPPLPERDPVQRIDWIFRKEEARA